VVNNGVLACHIARLGVGLEHSCPWDCAGVLQVWFSLALPQWPGIDSIIHFPSSGSTAGHRSVLIDRAQDLSWHLTMTYASVRWTHILACIATNCCMPWCTLETVKILMIWDWDEIQFIISFGSQGTVFTNNTPTLGSIAWSITPFACIGKGSEIRTLPWNFVPI
jgi:hypothetical protein